MKDKESLVDHELHELRRERNQARDERDAALRNVGSLSESLSKYIERCNELEKTLERMVEHFSSSVAAVPYGFGGKLIQEARLLVAKKAME